MLPLALQHCSAPCSPQSWSSGRRVQPARRQHSRRRELAPPAAAAAEEAAAGTAAQAASEQQQGAAASSCSKQQQGKEGERAAVPVTFILGGDEITVEAQPGQNLWEVANDAGAYITLGCSQGSCGVCEVEVWKYSGSGAGCVPSTGVVRACIAGVPPGYSRLEVREVPEDDIWGVDGFDT